MDASMYIGLGALGLVFFLEGSIPFYTKRQDRYSHGLRNLIVGLAAGLIGALAAPLLVWSVQWAEGQGVGLCNLGLLHPVACGLVAFVLFDLWMYAWHRMNHELPLLWRFHRVHHSDPAMDSTTALRFHPGEILISTVLNCVPMILLGMGIEGLVLYKSVMILVILFHHSNLAVPTGVDLWLRRIIVTPSLHRVHHSHLRAETDSDYGTVFSFWDRLFGTFRTRDRYEDIRFGIGAYDDDASQRPLRLLALPFLPLATRAER